MTYPSLADGEGVCRRTHDRDKARDYYEEDRQDDRSPHRREE